MGFLKKTKTTAKKLTPQERTELLSRINQNLSDEELDLLSRAVEKPFLKKIAVKELAKYV